MLQAVFQEEIERCASNAGSALSLSPNYLSTLAAACRENAVAELLARLLEATFQLIEVSHIPPFWARIESLDSGAPAQLVEVLALAANIVEACKWLVVATREYLRAQPVAYSPSEKALLLSLERRFSVHVAAVMYDTAPSKFPGMLTQFYQAALLNISFTSGAAVLDREEDMQLLDDDAPNAVRHASTALYRLGLGDMVDDVISGVVGKHLNDHLEATTQVSDESVLEAALLYSKTVPLEFLGMVLCEQPSRIAALEQWGSEIQLYVYQTVGSFRAAAMFDLVIDYPESLPALDDLKKCLSQTHAHRNLVIVFGGAIRARLLHPGAATMDIIQHYISTIRALRHVEPSGAVLEAVSSPLREYLRTRKDAIRCIVTMLTDDSDDSAGTSFLAELTDADLDVGGVTRVGLDVDFDGADADEQALLELDRWEPGPLEVAPLQTSHSFPTSTDIISLLVNIYGTKELFVSEYRSMLADRLLAKTNFDCDRELRTLELLKVRFGEASLHAPEVMLRDLADSKRINSTVHYVSNSYSPLKNVQDLVPIDGLSVTIVSQLYWPQLQIEEFNLPRQVQAMLRTYGQKYHAIKAPRALQWKPSLGSVSLTLTIGDKDLEFTVSPMHATLLLHFQERAEWNEEALSQVIGIDTEALRRKMVFWINQGIIRESLATENTSIYHRNEELQAPTGVPGDADGACDDLDVDRQGTEEAMSHFEPFVLGMLTNFDALPLDRIHNMLKMFVVDPPYDRTIEQLSAFMSKLSTEDKVVLEGSVYKRRSN